jgi:hypothetical protein
LMSHFNDSFSKILIIGNLKTVSSVSVVKSLVIQDLMVKWQTSCLVLAAEDLSNPKLNSVKYLKETLAQDHLLLLVEDVMEHLA